MSEELMPYKEGEIVRQSPNQLIALALEQKADPDTISKLMDLQERYEAGQARKAYVIAMTAFKREAPAVITKGDRVDFTSQKGRTAYNYANLGSIVQEITAILSKHDLSASWETRQDANVTVTCHITHSAGHRESVTLTGPPDESGNKNRIQAVGSTVTYLQRYTLLAALGLATGEDDDGRGGKDNTPIQQPQAKPTEQTGESKIISGIDNVTMAHFTKKDKSQGIKYIIYAGEKYETFSETFAREARRAKEAGLMVEIEYTEDNYGRKIKTFTVMEPREPGVEG